MVTGIHHLTAMCGEPQANVDFYAGLLGLRLVKVTVNYDDPGTYHLYYGDRLGSPGSALTFFPWPKAYRGRVGYGQVSLTAFSAPPDSRPFWEARLGEAGVEFASEDDRLSFKDPDGMPVAIAFAEDPREPWADGGVPQEHALRGFHSVALLVVDHVETERLLTGPMGFRLIDADKKKRFRYAVGEGLPHQIVDVLRRPSALDGRMGVGTVHHVAWRVPNDEAEMALRNELSAFGMSVTPQIDRTYFHSLYFREPSFVLFEIATDGPGFTVDEPADALGRSLVLPDWLESRRQAIEARLTPFAHNGVTYP